MKRGSKTVTSPGADAAAGMDAFCGLVVQPSKAAAPAPIRAKLKRMDISEGTVDSGGETLGGGADDIGERAGSKGRDQPGGADQFLERRRAAAAAQRDIGIEGRTIIFERLHPELERTAERQGVVDVIEGQTIDVVLGLPQPALGRVVEIAIVAPGQIAALQRLPQGVALGRARLRPRIDLVLEMVDADAVRQ